MNQNYQKIQDENFKFEKLQAIKQSTTTKF